MIKALISCGRNTASRTVFGGPIQGDDGIGPSVPPTAIHAYQLSSKNAKNQLCQRSRERKWIPPCAKKNATRAKITGGAVQTSPAADAYSRFDTSVRMS